MENSALLAHEKFDLIRGKASSLALLQLPLLVEKSGSTLSAIELVAASGGKASGGFLLPLQVTACC